MPDDAEVHVDREVLFHLVDFGDGQNPVGDLDLQRLTSDERWHVFVVVLGQYIVDGLLLAGGIIGVGLRG